MAGATLTTVNAISKEVYEGRIQSQLQDECVAFKRIERTSEGVTSQVGGKYVTFPLRVQRNTGIGYRKESGALPAAGQQGYAAVQIPLKYGYGRILMTGQTMDLIDSNYQAFASAMDDEMTNLKNDIAKDTNRVMYGNGSGVLATLTADGANTATVDTVQYLEIGMRIDFWASTLNTLQSNGVHYITGISGLVVTYDGNDVSGTTAAGSVIVREGAQTTASENLEPNGLGNIIAASGALHGLTHAKWVSTVSANGGTPRALSEGLMIRLTDDVRVQGGKTSLILASLGTRRAYFSLLSQQRRYTETKTFDGGIQGLAFHNGREIPVVEDVDAPSGKMWFIDESSLKIYRDKDWSFLQRDGNVWKWVVGYDSWECVLKQYWELGCKQRNANGLLSDITEA